MNLKENKITSSNEKEINLSKDDNSLYIKSLEETEFSFTELLKNKNFVSINCNYNDLLQVQNKSIFKIFSLFTDTKNGENIESNLVDYITCTILEEEISYNRDITNSIIGVLDTPYKKLLDETKKYKINIFSSNFDEIKKDLMSYDNQKNKIDIDTKSIQKISSYLNKTIYDISDYINIIILYNDDIDYDKDIIKRKLIDKYDSIGENVYFMGKKDFENNLKVPEKCKKDPIYQINIIFNNVLNKVDNIENNSSSDENNENNLNINGTNSKKFDDIKLKSEIYNSNEIKEDFDYDNDDYLLTDEQDKNGGCQKKFCPDCNIF